MLKYVQICKTSYKAGFDSQYIWFFNFSVCAYSSTIMALLEQFKTGIRKISGHWHGNQTTHQNAKGSCNPSSEIPDLQFQVWNSQIVPKRRRPKIHKKKLPPALYPVRIPTDAPPPDAPSVESRPPNQAPTMAQRVPGRLKGSRGVARPLREPGLPQGVEGNLNCGNGFPEVSELQKAASAFQRPQLFVFFLPEGGLFSRKQDCFSDSSSISARFPPCGGGAGSRCAEENTGPPGVSSERGGSPRTISG